MFKKFFGWLNLADLDTARREASMQVIARYSRGNTSIQDGRIMSRDDLARLSAAADQAMDRLRRAMRPQ